MGTMISELEMIQLCFVQLLKNADLTGTSDKCEPISYTCPSNICKSQDLVHTVPDLSFLFFHWFEKRYQNKVI